MGSLAGAGLGAIIGHQSGETGEGAAIGAALGGVGGYVLGNEQDKAEMQAQAAGAQAQAAAALQTASTVVINVRNTNGSITPITIRREGNLYVGPRGEIYTQLPTEDQLRPVYGF
ncbi:MAG: glycine zipper domain-containing protein [Candidatus Omnitrophica bacterium]|nr:glycine zipper domain-containing protein [Candidatus Omnitrophota bacterium]